MSDATSIVLVGHCGPDMFMLRSAMSRLAPDAAIETVNDCAALAPYLSAHNVLLINRVLDGEFGSDSGVELIQRIRSATAGADDAPRVILISNFPDAQQAAEAAGALPGFGKADLYEPETATKVQAALRAAGEHP